MTRTQELARQLNFYVDNVQMLEVAALLLEQELLISNLQKAVVKLKADVTWLTEFGPLAPDDIRKAGGIIHRDGNVFFTNLAKLNNAIKEFHY